MKAVRKEVPGAAPCHGPASRIAPGGHTRIYADERNTRSSASNRASPWWALATARMELRPTPGAPARLLERNFPVLLPRLPVKAVVHSDGQDAVLQGTVQPDEFLASGHAPTGFHPVFQQIGEHDAQGAVIQIFVLGGDRQPGR